MIKADLSYVLQEECQHVYAKPDPQLGQVIKINKTTQICASIPKIATGMCHGDSGGDFFLFINLLNKIFFNFSFYLYHDLPTVRVLLKYCVFSNYELKPMK